MSVDKEFLLNALLKENYFPFQKEDREELPPIFSSQSLTKEIAKEIYAVSLSNDRKKHGFDSVQFRATRFNNVPRLLVIPHVKPYIDSCFEIYKNWPKVRHICSNYNSLIRPRKHYDGRIIIMDYESSTDKRNRYYKLAFGKRFLVHTDISNCFPSLYSHSIPWALVGFDVAKKNRGQGEWFNKIDSAIRSCNRNETSGVAIGPAISNIACELILEKIDRVLKKKRFQYVRFIDDYTAYCKVHEEAEEFIRLLSAELTRYKMNLNIKKTEIKTLPQSISEMWISKMREIIPSNSEITDSKVCNVLDAAVQLQSNNPDGSILKYAAKSIVKKLSRSSSLEFSKYVIKLCFHYPILVPLLLRPLKTVYKYGDYDFSKEMKFLLINSVKYRRSDAICWLLYFMKMFHGQIPQKIANEIIETRDSLSILVLAEFDEHIKQVVRFAKSLDKRDYYELDTHWLLLYQLYFKGAINNLYSDKTFDVLKKNNVSFVKL